jgi:hypothetical protein
MNQSQVEGIDAILAEWEKRSYSDLRWLSYILGTVYHESAGTMKPVEEIGKGRGHNYGQPDPITGKTYYGRGRVQLTFKDNYLKFEKRLKMPLTTQPELMLTDEVDIPVLFDGMVQGLYTGVGLPKYFNDTREDFLNARKIVNVLDKAELISSYAKNFLKALS